MLPLGTSAVTIGFGMLITFDTPPVDWRAEWWLVPVGHALVAAPFVVRTLRTCTCTGAFADVELMNGETSISSLNSTTIVVVGSTSVVCAGDSRSADGG